jgi:hypothetical protein
MTEHNKLHAAPIANGCGVLSIALSLLFWFALLPTSVPGVGFIRLGVGVHLVLWAIAFVLAVIPVSKGSRWWILAMILPFANLAFLVIVIGLGEWISSRPG